MAIAKEINSFYFNHIALSVKDVDNAAIFYKEVLHLKEITNRTKMEDIRWFSFGEEKELNLISILIESVTTKKAVPFALTTANYDAFFKTLEVKNISFSDWPENQNKITLRANGIMQTYFQNPDGYWKEENSVG